MAKKLIHFDWAMKKLLRHKANFGILEGFLTELLKFDVYIESILESEANQEEENDKYNRVDILAKNHTGELFLIEIQNNPEMDYFHRMLYGASKLITEYIKLGESYGNIRKVYSINIVYFQLGHGKDYIYEYQGEFVGVHDQEVLKPTLYQRNEFRIEHLSDIYPKYYILKVNNFDDIAKDTLDEWIYFLKNSEVTENSNAQGLSEAKEKLDYEYLSFAEKKQYENYQKNRVIEANVEYTIRTEATHKGRQQGLKEGRKEGLKQGLKEGLEKGLEQGLEQGLERGLERGLKEGVEQGKLEQAQEIARKLKIAGLPEVEIIEVTGLSAEEIRQL